MPPGLRVRVVDGDLRLWMSVPRGLTVTVLDYQDAPYLRFTAAGVDANESSPMFYLNLEPPITPSLSLTRHTPPVWHRVASGRSYLWHDGRIAALAEDLSAPGARVLGSWTVPLLIDGRAATIDGGLEHRPRPSLAWLWPAAVVLLVLPALLRLRDAALERRVGRWVTVATLLAVVVAALGAGLHGRPGMSGTLLVAMAIQLAVVGWVTRRLLAGRDGALTMAVTAGLGLLRAVSGISVLWRGYVLLAVGPVAGRLAVATCLAGGISLAVQACVSVDRLRPGLARSAGTG